ncbi:acyltransferase family protein [Turneriella parva]|nr:acyltransferase family protein [Turneriella parva]
MSAHTLTYRPDLQGLRAIAVIAVLIFHVWPQTFRGGFVGVDVFFVISGFLITSLLIAEHEATGKVDLPRFWARRFLRLLPAASVVLIAVVVGTLIFLPKPMWISTGLQVLAAAVYFENWALVLQSVDYWAQGQLATPVQHFWSLSIEEQFYIFWPPLIAVCGVIAARGRRGIRFYGTLLVLVITAASLALSVVPDPESGSPYFKTTTRAWELALGALLALISHRQILPRWLRSIFGWLGLGAIAISVLAINEAMRFPGYAALLPTLGTVLLITCHNAPYSPHRLLALRPLQWVGDLSYSIYLWHWPLVVFTRPFGEEASQLSAAIVIGGSLLFAVLCKYLIEDPFRRGRIAELLQSASRGAFLRKAFLLSVFLILTTAGAGAFLNVYQRQQVEKVATQDFEAVIGDPNYPGAAAFDPVRPAPVPAGVPLKPDPVAAYVDMKYKYLMCQVKGKLCEYGNPNGKLTIALVGDSHAMHYAPALEALAKKHDWRLLVIVKVACPIGDFPLWRDGAIRSDCDWWRSNMTKWVLQEKPAFVVTSGGLTGVYGQLPPVERQVKGFREVFNKFIANGTKIIAIKDNPLMKYHKGKWMDVPPCLYYYRKDIKKCFRPRELTLDSMTDTMMLAADGMQGVATINLTQYFCTKDECPPVIGNVVVYRDQHHLTETFVNTLTPYLEKELFRRMAALKTEAGARP